MALIQIMLAIHVMVQFRTSELAQSDQFWQISSNFDNLKYQKKIMLVIDIVVLFRLSKPGKNVQFCPILMLQEMV